MQKTYLIAGGTSGIGLAIVRRLRETRPAARIISVSRRDAHPDQAGAANLGHIPRDLSVGPWDDAARKALPDSIDGLAYCPGSINLKPFHRLNAEDFLTDFQLNLMGAVHLIQACLPALQKGDAAQVLLFSTVAVQTGFPFHASISAAKGAVEGLTRALAAELAPAVAVNAIAPGLTDTPLAERLLKSENQRKAAVERSPLKSILSAEAVADIAVAVLATASPAMTGQVLAVDGGMSGVRL
ncbi:MAG: SDR family oxidoreductase [Leptospirales bacterium]|jgi:3-oxoacyl-[acyl-carrier protein] reductase